MANMLSPAPSTLPAARFDEVMAELQQGKDAWAKTSTAQKAAVITELLEPLPKITVEWVAATAKAKGIALGTPLEGEEWLTGPYITARNLRLLRRSLLEIDRSGAPRIPGRPSLSKAGRVVIPVFPTDLFDRLLFPFYQAEVWLEPNVTLENVKASIGAAYVPPA